MYELTPIIIHSPKKKKNTQKLAIIDVVSLDWGRSSIYAMFDIYVFVTFHSWDVFLHFSGTATAVHWHPQRHHLQNHTQLKEESMLNRVNTTLLLNIEWWDSRFMLQKASNRKNYSMMGRKKKNLGFELKGQGLVSIANNIL